MAKAVRQKKSLIPKGTPHPIDRKYKYKESHLRKRDAEKAADEMQMKDRNLAVKLVHVPNQHCIYGRKFKPISRKRPRLS